MKLSMAILASLLIVLALFYLQRWVDIHPASERPALLTVSAWQDMASPGQLSVAHTFMEHDCAACHTAVKGPDAAKCGACHANNASLLTKQSTVFHATVGDCRGCHKEHRGPTQIETIMDHLVLSRIGRKNISEAGLPTPIVLKPAHSRISADETLLDCSACHANQDPHRTLFGNDCASCHATSQWSIAEFQHPSALSTDCAQCHQAPPSHYMMHFTMVSMSVAGIEHADVTQCFLCHQTNAWNDIPGVGWYKHH